MSEQRNIEIGEKLRAARLAKGFTLDDIQQTTKIQKRYLNAIENGDFEQLPGDFYVRAFTKQFAQAVDLDSEELLVNAPQEVIEPTTDLSNSRTDLDNVTRTGMDMEPTPADKFQNLIPKIIIGLLVVVVLVVIWVIALSLSKGSDSQHAVDTSSVSVSSTKVNKADKIKESSTKETKKKVAKKTKPSEKLAITDGEVSGSTTTFKVSGTSVKKHNLVISSKYRTWVTVTTNDGTSLANEMLQANDSKQIDIPENATEISIRSGFATGTNIELDNQKVKIPDSDVLTRNYNFTFDQSTDNKGDN